MELSVNAFARNILVWAQMPDLDPEASQGNNNMSGALKTIQCRKQLALVSALILNFNLQDNEKYKSIGKLLAVSFFTAVIASACTEDAMDKVNKNPNNPQDAPAKFLITDLGVSTAFSTVGGDFSLYSSVYMEHETGIGNQLYRAEVRSGEPTTATTYNNAWISVYANIKNAKIVINKCQEDPSEKRQCSNWKQ